MSGYLPEGCSQADIDRHLDGDEEPDDYCPECDHLWSRHGDEGCEYERGDQWIDGKSIGGWMAMGPCGCKETKSN